MNIFGLYITKASTIAKERDAVKSALKALFKKRAQDNTLWDKVMSKLLWENFNLRKAR